MATHYNMIKMSTATTGTATVALGSAITGFLALSADANAADGNVVTYVIEDGANREMGRGTIGGTKTTISRDTVLASTNSGSKINLSGSAIIGITLAAEDMVYNPRASFTAAEKKTALTNLGVGAAYSHLHSINGGL